MCGDGLKDKQRDGCMRIRIKWTCSLLDMTLTITISPFPCFHLNAKRISIYIVQCEIWLNNWLCVIRLREAMYVCMYKQQHYDHHNKKQEEAWNKEV